MKVKFVIVLLGGFLTAFASFSASAQSNEEYYAIFIDGQKSGYGIHSRIVDGNSVRTSEEIKITMDRMSTPVSVSTTETYIESIAGEPLGFETVMNMSLFVTKTYGKVGDDGKVEVKSVTGQLESKKTIDWPKGALMAEGLRLMELKGGLTEGNTFSAMLFVPSLLQAVGAKAVIGKKTDVDLLGRVVKLTEVTTTMFMPMTGNIVSKTYVDDDLNALKAVMPMIGMNLELVACSKELALSPDDPAELMNKAFIKSPKPLGDLNRVKSVRYKIRPVKTATNFSIPVTDNQKVKKLSDGTIVLTVRPVKIKKDKIGYKGNAPEVLKYLEPNRYVQSDNETIRKLAKEAVGNTTDAAQAVRKIEAFVGDYIHNRSLSVGYASAVEVAQSRQGDCSEFAVLTASLCRAVGIPAKVAVGVAYVGDYEGFKNVFGGHAWTEGYVGGKWVGLDASFKGGGRGGYDAGHITLATGGGNPEDFMQMVFSIGQFEIEDAAIEF